MKILSKYLNILLSGIFIPLIGFNLWAQEIDNGSKEIWSGQQTLYADKTINHDDTLIIKPGTVIDFQSYELVVYGTLLSEGTPLPSGLINFYTSNTQTGWKGIKFETTQTKSVLKHCTISGIVPDTSNANKSPEVEVKHAILIKQATDTILIDHCEFTDNKAGIYITNASNDVIISNSYFHDNSIGEDIEGLVAVGLNSICQLIGNEFVDNTVHAKGLFRMLEGSYAFVINNSFKSTASSSNQESISAVIYSYYHGTLTYNTCWIMGNVFENNYKQDVLLELFG